MTTIRLDHLTKTFSGSTTPVVDDVSLDIADGEFVVLVGPSGSGKSTIMRMIVALEDITSGEVFLDRKPSQLSGGQRQRVAMGRAIVRQPDAFLSDEPLSNLDAKLRGQTRTEISRLQHRLGVTTVYVTHDQIEAMTLGDRVAALRKGVLQQVDAPRELYQHPVNLFVAGFIGSPSMNFMPAATDGVRLRLPVGDIELTPDAATQIAGHDILIAGVRPEHIEDAAAVDDEGRRHGLVFRAKVDVIEWLGSEQLAYVPFDAPAQVRRILGELANELDSETMRTQLIVTLNPETPLRKGQHAELWLDPPHVQLFDPESGNTLPPRHGVGTRQPVSTTAR